MKKELVQIQKLKNGKIINMTDETATEVRFEVKTWGREGFSMSCTPENLEELVIGILFSKGYIESAEQVERVEVSYENFEIHAVLTDRRFPGFGKKEKEVFEVPDVAELFRTAEEILGNPGELFSDTGCAHCCTLALDGRVICSFEDVGRHNALDKVIGRGLKQKVDFSKAIIFTTGRISGDYIQKIIRAGMPCVVSRSAVTGEAVKLAKEHNIRMFGFVRGGDGNIYN